MIRYSLNMQVPPSRFPFSHEDQLIFLGSCFSEHISDRLQELSWKVTAMPNGIVFNPVSLAEPFQRILESKDYTENDLVFHQGLWHGKYHHGSFSEVNVQDALRKMNHNLHELKRSLQHSSHVFVTFGTAYAYRYKQSGDTFANCHKIPQDQFEKYLLHPSQIELIWAEILQKLHQHYPDLKVIFTVSPVKHLRDGVAENSRSKAILLSTVHTLTEQFDFSEYFPAFELVAEDLRDYRFYELDGAHPNSMSIDYVMDKFCECYLDDPGKAYLKDMLEYQSMSRHRILRVDAEESRKFMSKLEQLRQKISELYGVEL